MSRAGSQTLAGARGGEASVGVEGTMICCCCEDAMSVILLWDTLSVLQVLTLAPN